MTAAAYRARLQERLDRQPVDAEYANLLRAARLHHLLADGPYESALEEPEKGVRLNRSQTRLGDVARQMGTGPRESDGTDKVAASLSPGSSSVGPLFALAAALARAEWDLSGEFAPKVSTPLGDRLTLVRDGAA